MTREVLPGHPSEARRGGRAPVDGTKLAALASNHANRGYEQIAREILAEAGCSDAAEDELLTVEEFVRPHRDGGQLTSVADPASLRRERVRVDTAG
jgi:hypothetical protein